MDEGWTRYMLDDLGIEYTVLHNKDFKATKDKKVNLKSSFDVLIFASENVDIIKTGQPGQRSEFARFFRAGTTPPEYEGGIEKEGIDAIKAMVEEGGMLVTLNQASELAMRELGARPGIALSGWTAQILLPDLHSQAQGGQRFPAGLRPGGRSWGHLFSEPGF